jgi:protein-L-isoaspartate O-methyltransferase
LGEDAEHAIITPDQAHQIALIGHSRLIDHCLRWIKHYDNRLAYEQTMLEDQGGLPAEKFDIEPGGMVLTGGEWVTVIRVNRSNGAITSVTTNARYVRVKNIETIKDYKPPTEEDKIRVKNATTLPPLCNYPGEGIKEITKADWKRRYHDGKGTQDVEATETTPRHRVRYFYTMYGKPPIQQVYITDEKRKDPPLLSGAPAVEPELPSERVLPQPTYTPPEAKPEAQPFEAMRETLRAGIQVVTAPQLFATSADKAAYMVELLDPQPGNDILEPEAGTGALIKPLADFSYWITAVEINPALADQLRARWETENNGTDRKPACVKVVCADFLECNGNLGEFDRIIMNPPFVDATDIKHIKHAIGFLKAGGRLVALCANGHRQREQLKPLADYWEDLPAGSFSDQGTNVNVALLVINASTEPTKPTETGWLF